MGRRKDAIDAALEELGEYVADGGELFDLEDVARKPLEKLIKKVLSGQMDDYSPDLLITMTEERLKKAMHG